MGLCLWLVFFIFFKNNSFFNSLSTFFSFLSYFFIYLFIWRVIYSWIKTWLIKIWLWLNKIDFLKNNKMKMIDGNLLSLKLSTHFILVTPSSSGCAILRYTIQRFVVYQFTSREERCHWWGPGGPCPTPLPSLISELKKVQ